MGILSIFKKKGDFNLTKSDFKTDTHDSEVVSVKLSDDFFDLFPEARKSDPKIGKSSLITNTAIVELFANKVALTYESNEINIQEDKFICQINWKLNWIMNNKDEVNHFIIDNLLSLKNENWIEENETEITEKEFLMRIKLIGITFFSDGGFELIFDDGNLFSGHQIVANLNSKCKLNKANIQG